MARCPDCGSAAYSAENGCPACRQAIPAHRLAEDLAAVADALGHAPSVTEYVRAGRYSRTPFQRVFDTWPDALHAAGLTPEREWGIDDGRLVHDLRAVADELGETPSKREYDAHGRWSASTLQDRFGSWTTAIDEAGLKVTGCGAPAPKYAELGPEDVGLSPIGAREGGRP